MCTHTHMHKIAHKRSLTPSSSSCHHLLRSAKWFSRGTKVHRIFLPLASSSDFLSRSLSLSLLSPPVLSHLILTALTLLTSCLILPFPFPPHALFLISLFTRMHGHRCTHTHSLLFLSSVLLLLSARNDRRTEESPSLACGSLPLTN